MLRRETESLSQRYNRFEKVIFPLQIKIIETASHSLNTLKTFLGSDKGPSSKARVKESLDQWRAALDEYQKNTAAD